MTDSVGPTPAAHHDAHHDLDGGGMPPAAPGTAAPNVPLRYPLVVAAERALRTFAHAGLDRPAAVRLLSMWHDAHRLSRAERDAVLARFPMGPGAGWSSGRVGAPAGVSPLVQAAVEAVRAFAPGQEASITRDQAEGVLRLWGRVHELAGPDMVDVLDHFTAAPAVDPEVRP